MGNYIDINKNIKLFIDGDGKNKGMKPTERYASFDYCYNYFQSFREKNTISDLCSDTNIELSCLQLAFYLASWGMFRGSTFLLEKSYKYFENTIHLISNYDKRIWSVDVDTYNDENIDILLEFKSSLKDVLNTEREPSDTLITKIMLGVFANTPAFDTLFGEGFGVKTFNKKSLRIISDFYQTNQTAIDSYKIHTIDYLTATKTSRVYTKAKLVDMIGFIEGQS